MQKPGGAVEYRRLPVDNDQVPRLLAHDSKRDSEPDIKFIPEAEDEPTLSYSM